MIYCLPKSGASWLVRVVPQLDCRVLGPSDISTGVFVVRHPYRVINSLYGTPLYATTSQLHPNLPSYGYDWVWVENDQFAKLAAYWEFLVSKALKTCEAWFRIEDISSYPEKFEEFCRVVGVRIEDTNFQKYFAIKTNRSHKHYLPSCLCSLPKPQRKLLEMICRSATKVGYRF